MSTSSSPVDETDDLIPTERIALVVYDLCLGKRLTIDAIRRRTGYSQSGAYDLMYRLERVLPIYPGEHGWFLNQGDGDP